MLEGLRGATDWTTLMGRELRHRAFGAEDVAAGRGHGGFRLEIVETDDADEDWGKMAARKNKHSKGKENNSSGLEDLTRGLNI